MVTDAQVEAAFKLLWNGGDLTRADVRAALEAAEAAAWQQGMDTAPTDAQQRGLVLLAHEPFEAATCEAWKPEDHPWKPCKGREEFWKPPTHWRIIKPPANVIKACAPKPQAGA